MLKPIRKTLTGQIEYWDTEKKLVVVGSGGSDDLSAMTVAQLKEYAANHNVTIPATVTKKEDIIKLLSDGK
ncbi:hypothetical protein [Heyndrickxia coagulans]|uniref:hypothetical protein n=1 Tax=Heyndrickxia coagulans TaxID=1398 RepID=UPI0018A7B9C0|nr:hypothetical protein [Heyndrickxia coagulans]MBF8418936.1 hypothetical protein [Heyndrickxia coagulans]